MRRTPTKISRCTNHRHKAVVTISSLMAICLSSSTFATVLKLDGNGNYVDAQSSQIGTTATPYAAPSLIDTPAIPESTEIDTSEEVALFPDPNGAIATDASRMENPATQYEIILYETDAIADLIGEKSESGERDERDALAETETNTPRIISSGINTAVEQNLADNTTLEFEPAEPGGLVFKDIVKPDEIVLVKTLDETGVETVSTTNLDNSGPVVLKAMRTLEPAIEAGTADMAKLDGPKTFDTIILAEVAKYENIDIAFVKAVISAESNYNMIAVSPKGAMGLMQIMPATAETYGVINPFSPEENIRTGTAELSRLMDVYKNPTLALAAYNAGEGAVETHNGVPPYKETRDYIVRVLTKTFAAREQMASVQIIPESEDSNKAKDDPITRPLVVQSFDW